MASGSNANHTWLPDELEQIYHTVIKNIFKTPWFLDNELEDYRASKNLAYGHDEERQRRAEEMKNDTIRRYNLSAQLVNAHVDARAMSAEVHPKRITSGPGKGHYPKDLQLPKRLQEFLKMDNATIDGILYDYELPLSPPLILSEQWYRGPVNGKFVSRETRLQVLLEYLGVAVYDSSDGRTKQKRVHFEDLQPGHFAEG